VQKGMKCRFGSRAAAGAAMNAAMAA